jgi:hypothetical protein
MKNLNCCKAKGEVDACPICFSNVSISSEKENFIKSQHEQLVIKSSRAIRGILLHLPKG